MSVCVYVVVFVSTLQYNANGIPNTTGKPLKLLWPHFGPDSQINFNHEISQGREPTANKQLTLNFNIQLLFVSNWEKKIKTNCLRTRKNVWEFMHAHDVNDDAEED